MCPTSPAHIDNQEEKIEISYDLLGSVDRKFEISLYYYKGTDTTEWYAGSVEGDVGIDVAAGIE